MQFISPLTGDTAEEEGAEQQKPLIQYLTG